MVGAAGHAFPGVRRPTRVHWSAEGPSHAWVFGEVGSGAQLPTSLDFSCGTLSLEQAEKGGGPAPLLPRALWPPLDPFKTA